MTTYRETILNLTALVCAVLFLSAMILGYVTAQAVVAW